MKERMRRAMVSPYRFFVVAAILAALFSMLPMQADTPQEREIFLAAQEEISAQGDGKMFMGEGVPAGADLSQQTQEGTFLHRTMSYACGHSVQRREPLPAQLRGLNHAALDETIGTVMPKVQVTGFSVREVDVVQRMEIPCPLHWVLRLGERGTLEVLQNVDGESLFVIREMEIEREMLGEETVQELLAGMTFDDVQALEGYLESLNS